MNLALGICQDDGGMINANGVLARMILPTLSPQNLVLCFGKLPCSEKSFFRMMK